MRTNLTKKEIVNSIYMKLGLSKRILDIILEDILNLIFESLKKNKKVKISNFGTFEVRYKKKRSGRNPKTKKTAVIKARKTISFKASKELKSYINNKDE